MMCNFCLRVAACVALSISIPELHCWNIMQPTNNHPENNILIASTPALVVLNYILTRGIAVLVVSNTVNHNLIVSTI